MIGLKKGKGVLYFDCYSYRNVLCFHYARRISHFRKDVAIMNSVINKRYEGSISIRPNGLYQASVMVGGVRKFLYARTEDEVRLKMKSYIVDATRGMLESRTRFGKYFNDWLVNTKKRRLKPTSYDRLERTYKYYIKDELENIPLDEVTTQKCQMIVNKASDKVAYSTVKKVFEAMNACLSYAVKVGDLQRNPMTAVEMPREDATAIPTKETIIPTVEEMKHLLEVGRETYGNGRPIFNQNYVDAYRFICETGLRIGELLALKWKKISFEKETARIDASVCEVINRDFAKSDKNAKHLKRLVTDTKTKSGTRTIHLNKEALEILSSLKARNKEQGISSEYIFCNSKGNPASYHEMQRTLARICVKAGMDPFGLHTLRHYFASRCLADGAEPLALSKHLGHSKPSITMNIYAHLMPKQNAEFNAVLENMESNRPSDLQK